MPEKTRLTAVSPDTPLLIEGNFRPPKKAKRLKTLVTVVGVLTGISLVAALSVYAVNVQLVSHMNEVGKKTREINESNKDLMVRLNRIRAFKNIEASAARMSHLQPPQEVIELTVPESKLKALENTALKPIHKGEQPRVYGY